MDEAENLADRIAVIAAGRIVAEGTPETLGGRQRMASTLRFTLPGGFDVGVLPDSLRDMGAEVEVVPSYETVLDADKAESIREQLKQGEIDVKGFAEVIRVMGEAGELKPPLPPVERFIDLQYLKAAGLQ